MLCPKCGFISFDDLSTCGKCRHDLSGVGAELRGTAAEVAGHFFLGALIKEGVGAQGSADAVEISSTLAESSALAEDEGGGEEMSALDLDRTGQEEEVSLFAADETPEAPALEFDLDEIPHLESAERVLAAGPATQAESPLPAGTEAALLTLEEEKSVAAAPEAPAAGPSESEIDFSNLNLVSSEEEPLVPAEEPSEFEPGQRSVDLNAIDLSDLVHPEAGAVPAPSGVGVTEEGGLQLDDTMDLSLFVGENGPALPAEADFASGAEDLNPIDLTLVDDALVELTDPGKKSVTPPVKGGQSLQGLSMEESDKA